MRRAALLIIAGPLVPLLFAAAQDPGQRIRLKMDSAPSRWVVGTLMRQDADSLRLQVGGHAAPISVARSEVTHLEISRGRMRSVLQGAGVGFGLGVITGAVVGRAAGSHPCSGTFDPGFCHVGEAGYVAEGGLIGGAIGGLVGAALGFAMRTERWQGVPVDHAHLTLAPRELGIWLSLSF